MSTPHEEPETCEDRDYLCCNLFPPDPNATPTESAAWYDQHLTAYQSLDHGKTGLRSPQ